MTNLVLFVATVALYFNVYYWLVGKYLEEANDRKTNIKVLALIIVLSLPININDHVFTVFGNAVGKKSVYSVASLYQRARDDDGDAIAVLASGYQRADNTLIFFGVSGYQQAGSVAIILGGVSMYQRAGKIATTGVGVSLYQRAEMDAVTAIGVSGYQQAGNSALTAIGLALYQKAGDQSRAFAVWSPLKAEKTLTQK